jgi:HEXXH motif-containing protein
MSYPVMDHPELALLEAILHEYNHNKLYLILQTEVLVLNDTKEIYYSPYRPDARHIHGIYLWLHALTGAYWTIWNAHSQWIITISERWIEKAALYVFKNGLALQILDKYGLFTPTGKVFLDEMRQVHVECLQYVKQAHISQEIMHNIKDELAKHYNAVKQLYPNLHA